MGGDVGTQAAGGAILQLREGDAEAEFAQGGGRLVTAVVGDVAEARGDQAHPVEHAGDPAGECGRRMLVAQGGKVAAASGAQAADHRPGTQAAKQARRGHGGGDPDELRDAAVDEAGKVGGEAVGERQPADQPDRQRQCAAVPAG